LLGMKTFVYNLVFVFTYIQLWSQTPEIEKLIAAADKASGKEKIMALAEVSKQFYSIDPQKGIDYGNKALLLADSLKIPSVKSKIYNNIGVNYWVFSNQKMAREYYDKALKNKTIILQKTMIFITILFLVLLVVSGHFIMKSRRKIIKGNELLDKMNQDLSAKAQDLKVINEQLIDLSKFKDSMTAFLAHDLKNALNTIINFDPRSNPEYQVEMVKNSGKRMLNLVMNMLDINRFESDKMNMVLKDVAIDRILQNAFDHIMFQAHQKSIKLCADD